MTTPPEARRRLRRLGILLGCLASLAVPASAQVAPELSVRGPPGLVSGTTVELSTFLSPKDAQTLAWSLAVRLDGFQALETSTAGTDAEALLSDGYVEHGLHPDGSAYFSIGVLSFTGSVTLPAGSHRVLRTRTLVSRKDPGPVTAVAVNGLEIPGDERTFNNEVLLRGGATIAVGGKDASFPITGCAGLRLEPAFILPGPGERIEVRRGTPIEARVVVHIASTQHLQPEGFIFGVAHDPALLSLDGAALTPEVLDDFVADDGVALIERSSAGFAVHVLSSARSPRTLTPGDHVVATARYLFEGSAPGRALIDTALEVSDAPLGLLGETSTRTSFEPRGAVPCDLERLALSLRVGPDYWVRGDSDASGIVNLSDAITALQHLFLGGPAPCRRAMDSNADGSIDITDPIGLLNHLFLGAGPLPPPYPACGAAEETFPCDKFPCPAA